MSSGSPAWISSSSNRSSSSSSTPISLSPEDRDPLSSCKPNEALGVLIISPLESKLAEWTRWMRQQRTDRLTSSESIPPPPPMEPKTWRSPEMSKSLCQNNNRIAQCYTVCLGRHRGKTLPPPPPLFFFGRAVTSIRSQRLLHNMTNSRTVFTVRIHACSTSILSHETQYFYTLDTFRYNRNMHLSQHKSCTRKMELALEVNFHLDSHWVTRPSDKR